MQDCKLARVVKLGEILSKVTENCRCPYGVAGEDKQVFYEQGVDLAIAEKELIFLKDAERKVDYRVRMIRHDKFVERLNSLSLNFPAVCGC